MRMVFVSAIAIAASGVIAERYLSASPSKPVAAVESLPKVEVEHPRRATVAHRLQSNATLEAFEEADLFAKISGYLTEVRVDIGDHVKAGQVLAVISVPEIEQELAEAKAQLDAKQKMLETARREIDHRKADVALQEITLKRQDALFKGRAITDQALDEIRSKAEIARADLGVAEANRGLASAQVDVAAATVEKIKALLGYSQIIAPFDGVVARRLVNRGDLVQAATANRTTPLFTVQRIDTMRVFCDIPENDVPHVRVGDPATVTPSGFDGKSFTGTVTRFAFRLDPQTRNMRTEVDLPNPDERLYPGMYAEVSLEMDRRQDVLTVPATAIVANGTDKFVDVIKDDRIDRLSIKTGITDNGRVEVIDGIAEDASVVVTARSAPQPGTVVQPTVRENYLKG
jgi:RND family efflux transporter MFP subunit